MENNALHKSSQDVCQFFIILSQGSYQVLDGQSQVSYTTTYINFRKPVRSLLEPPKTFEVLDDERLWSVHRLLVTPGTENTKLSLDHVCPDPVCLDPVWTMSVWTLFVWTLSGPISDFRCSVVPSQWERSSLKRYLRVCELRQLPE